MDTKKIWGSEDDDEFLIEDDEDQEALTYNSKKRCRGIKENDDNDDKQEQERQDYGSVFDGTIAADKEGAEENDKEDKHMVIDDQLEEDYLSKKKKKKRANKNMVTGPVVDKRNASFPHLYENDFNGISDIEYIITGVAQLMTRLILVQHLQDRYSPLSPIESTVNYHKMIEFKTSSSDVGTCLTYAAFFDHGNALF